jgi:hypothetical protein
MHLQDPTTNLKKSNEKEFRCGLSLVIIMTKRII